MAGKRRATSELTRDNWDHDEPVEESGVYTKASEEILKKRVFKTAKRRIPRSTEEGSVNAFNAASLANLTSKSQQSTNQLFSFLSEMKPNTSKTNGVSNKPDNQVDGKVETSSLFSFGNKSGNLDLKTSTPSVNTSQKIEGSGNTMFSFGDANSKVENKTSTSLPTFSFSASKNSEMLGKSENPLLNSGNEKDKSTSQSEKKSDNINHYYARLKGLNESVAKWINKHVEDNPLINLQPIFKDYEKFFDEIEKEYHKIDNVEADVKNDSQKDNKGFNFTSTLPEKEKNTPLNAFKFSATPVDSNTATNKTDPPSNSLFKFGAPSSSNDNLSGKELASPASTFKFGNTSTSNNVTNNKIEQPSFKFETSTGNDVTNTKLPPKYGFGDTGSGFGGFSFTSNPTISSSSPGTINFGSIPSSTPSNNDGNQDDEESEEPPKVEVKEVEEEGQIYTIRCKLFVKKDGNFVEKGVGNLFLKPVPDSDKIQVIVRAHNSLANVLCNFILSKSIPTKRMGKNNVVIVCIPTPESKPPPVAVLIKVKTGEDADQLYETLEKHKN